MSPVSRYALPNVCHDTTLIATRNTNVLQKFIKIAEAWWFMNVPYAPRMRRL
ncbi:MAG: hypothetical protein ACRC46_12360 [Thermoguttaceae bacterium]